MSCKRRAAVHARFTLRIWAAVWSLAVLVVRTIVVGPVIKGWKMPNCRFYAVGELGHLTLGPGLSVRNWALARELT